MCSKNLLCAVFLSFAAISKEPPYAFALRFFYLLGFDDGLLFQRPISPFQLRVGEWMSGARMGANVAITTSTSGDPSALFSRDIAADAKVENMTPQLRPRPRLVALSDDMLLKLGNAVSLSQITVST